MLLSEDESEYIDLVRDRAIRQIESGVWEGIARDRLDGWLASLKNFDAELLGAYLLDNLCYRSRAQYTAMLDAMFLDLPMPGGASQSLLVDALRLEKAANPKCGVRLARPSLAPTYCGWRSAGFGCTTIGSCGHIFLRSRAP